MECAKPGGNLEGMTVRRLTAMFRDKVVQTPACEAKWILRHGPIEFHMVWAWELRTFDVRRHPCGSLPLVERDHAVVSSVGLMMCWSIETTCCNSFR